MELQEIKQINLTILFSEPLNHLLITLGKVLDVLKTGDKKLDQYNFIEAPSLKVFVFPNRQKELVFEANRLLVNDKSGSSPKVSEVVNYLSKIMKSGLIPQEKVAAFGFNYDAVISPSAKKMKSTDFVSNKIAKIIKKIEKAGVQLVFHKGKIRFNFQTQPINKNKLLAHLNAHYSEALPSEEKLEKNLVKEFNYFISLIKKL